MSAKRRMSRVTGVVHQSPPPVSASHRPNVQINLVPDVWWLAWVLSHTVLLPPVGILANLRGHMATWSTSPLLSSSEQRGDSFKWYLILEILTNEAASPEHPGYRGQRAEGRVCLGDWVSDWALTAWQASHCNFWSHLPDHSKVLKQEETRAMANPTGGQIGHVTGHHSTPSQVTLQDRGSSSGPSYQERGAVLILHTSLSHVPGHGLEQLT